MVVVVVVTFPFPSHYLPPQNSGPCNSFHCLGHFKNVHDDDDDNDPCNSCGVDAYDEWRSGVSVRVCHWRQRRRGCRGHIPPQYFGWGGDVNGNIPPILLRTFGYSIPILVALRSLSLKPISFGYKTPPVRFSQADGSQGSSPPQP